MAETYTAPFQTGWRVGDAGFTVFGPPNGKPSPETIAQVRKRSNARVLAAAPELLVALAEVRNCLLDWVDIADDEDQRAGDYAALDRAFAALTKAGVPVERGLSIEIVLEGAS